MSISHGPAPSTVVVPFECHTIRHIDEEGYECGGPHYLPPDMPYNGCFVWCEPHNVWVAFSIEHA